MSSGWPSARCTAPPRAGISESERCTQAQRQAGTGWRRRRLGAGPGIRRRGRRYSASREKRMRRGRGRPGLGAGSACQVLVGAAAAWRVVQASTKGGAIGRSRRSMLGASLTMACAPSPQNFRQAPLAAPAFSGWSASAPRWPGDTMGARTSRACGAADSCRWVCPGWLRQAFARLEATANSQNSSTVNAVRRLVRLFAKRLTIMLGSEGADCSSRCRSNVDQCQAATGVDHGHRRFSLHISHAVRLVLNAVGLLHFAQMAHERPRC